MDKCGGSLFSRTKGQQLLCRPSEIPSFNYCRASDDFGDYAISNRFFERKNFSPAGYSGRRGLLRGDIPDAAAYCPVSDRRSFPVSSDLQA